MSREDNDWLPGTRWGDAHSAYSCVHPMLQPNSPSCGAGNAEDWVMMSASSNHTGGVNVAMGDGSVQFISDTVNAGDPTVSPLVPKQLVSDATRPQDYSGPSLYGVWGSLSSAAGGESISVP